MDNIVKDLSPRQKARMHQVADGMLLIYNTLVRMRFLLPSWVQHGPHDVDHLLPLYQSLNLDASIIYLYSILPYVNNADVEGIDFLMGGEFADFRQKDDIEQARDPMYGGGDDELMRPWMTALSHIGNHDCAIIYDSRKHRIGIYNAMDIDGSRDHNIHEGWTITHSTDGDQVFTHLSPPVESEEESDEEESDEEEEEEGYEEKTDNDDDDREEEEDDDDDDDGSDACVWDEKLETNGRRAPNVLRDIVIWYENLTETPGGGEQSSGMWGHQEIVKSLYQKHGWPAPTFDGDAFLADMLRAEAARSVQYDFEYLARQLRALDGREPPDDARAHAMIAAAAAKGLDEEWRVRWELFFAQRMKLKVDKRKAHLELKIQEQKEPSSEDVLFAELKKLRQDWQYYSRELKGLQEQMDDAAATDRQEDVDRELQLRHEWKGCQVQNYQRAYEACRADFERDFPGRLATLECVLQRPPSPNPDYEVSIESLTEGIGELEQDITAFQQWIGQLPEGANQARKSAEQIVENYRSGVERCIKQRDGCVADLRKNDPVLG